jgi:hypothetical protein
MSAREMRQTGLRLAGRRPSVRCRACDADVAFLSRGLCTECREDARLAPYGYINGECGECGATEGHRMIDGEPCPVVA